MSVLCMKIFNAEKHDVMGWLIGAISATVTVADGVGNAVPSLFTSFIFMRNQTLLKSKYW